MRVCLDVAVPFRVSSDLAAQRGDIPVACRVVKLARSTPFPLPGTASTTTDATTTITITTTTAAAAAAATTARTTPTTA